MTFILMCGDFNARTSNNDDFITNDNSEYLPYDNNYQPDYDLKNIDLVKIKSKILTEETS